MPPSHPAANVRAELARRRISSQQLAEAIGMGRESMARRLREQTDFKISELSAVANYLGIPVTELLNGAAS